MRLRERAEVALVSAVFAGMAMFFAGFISLMTFFEYIYDEDGEISAGMGSAVCVPIGIALLIAVMVFNLTLALLILRSAGTDRARRAAYIQILFPLLLASFMLSTPLASFTPSIAFGWPLLLLGAILYPYSAIVMKQEVKAMEMKNLLRIKCFECSYAFEMHREEDWVRCPYCGKANLNPVKAIEEEKVKEEGAREP
ncbi:MAG: hypothetical protein GQ558_07565 [Thermoplasmata archaeon]|nr:hypothetical protein [Thermoplasmata archaeon]